MGLDGRQGDAHAPTPSARPAAAGAPWRPAPSPPPRSPRWWSPHRPRPAAVPAPPAGFSLVLRRRLQRRRRHPDQRGQLALRPRHQLPRRRAELGHRRGRDDDQQHSANVSLDGAGHLAITPLPGRGRQLDLGPDRDPSHRLPAAGRRQAADRGVAPAAATSPAPRPPATGRRSGRWAPRPGRSARPTGRASARSTSWRTINGRSPVFATLHCGPCIPGTCNETTGLGSGERACPGCQTGFHTYGVEWDRSVNPETLRWYRDGAVYFTAQPQPGRPRVLGHRAPTTATSSSSTSRSAAASRPRSAAARPRRPGSGVPMLVDYVAVYSGRRRHHRRRHHDPADDHAAADTPPPGGVSAYAHDPGRVVQRRPERHPAGGDHRRRRRPGHRLHRQRRLGVVPERRLRQHAGAPVQRPGRLRCRRRGERAGRGAAGQPDRRAGRQLRGRQHRRLADLAHGPGEHQRGDRAHTVFLTFTSGQPADFVNVNWFTFAPLTQRGERARAGCDAPGPAAETAPGPGCHDATVRSTLDSRITPSDAAGGATMSPVRAVLRYGRINRVQIGDDDAHDSLLCALMEAPPAESGPDRIPAEDKVLSLGTLSASAGGSSAVSPAVVRAEHAAADRTCARRAWTPGSTAWCHGRRRARRAGPAAAGPAGPAALAAAVDRHDLLGGR